MQLQRETYAQWHYRTERMYRTPPMRDRFWKALRDLRCFLFMM